MKFHEALKALEEGKRVRCKAWGRDAYWSFAREDGSLWVTLTDIFNLSCQEWEIYEEPKKTYSFKEVVEGLKNGKKFRRPKWRKDRNELWTFGERVQGLFDLEDFEATDWLEV